MRQNNFSKNRQFFGGHFPPIIFHKKYYITRKCLSLCSVVIQPRTLSLKDAIKAKKAPEFDNFPADKLKLWKVEIPDDHDDPLNNLSLQDQRTTCNKKDFEILSRLTF